MSTKIRTLRGSIALRPTTCCLPPSEFTVAIDHLGGGVVAHRADFLAAVETECGVRVVPADAIVIERAELPRLTARVGSVSAKEFTWSKSSDPDDLREVAACYLAAAEYLDAHPPVPPVSDEDVETLAGLIQDARAGRLRPDNSVNLARLVLATGRVSVTK